ncbi:hypothetical protein [Brenneria goodwinii]|uniref:hypothetical protein n=1 Tax=Brenneria goodwinii TaxID=1109412 RepID=UPI0036EF15BD
MNETLRNVNQKPFWGYMTEKGPIIISSELPYDSEVFKVIQNAYTSSNEIITNDGGGNMNERVARLESDVGHIKNDISDIKSSLSRLDITVKSVDKNVALILEKLDGVKDSLSKKPSADAIDKKISEAKVSQIIWTIASILTVVSIASGIIIKTLHL